VAQGPTSHILVAIQLHKLLVLVYHELQLHFSVIQYLIYSFDKLPPTECRAHSQYHIGYWLYNKNMMKYTNVYKTAEMYKKFNVALAEIQSAIRYHKTTNRRPRLLLEHLT